MTFIIYSILIVSYSTAAVSLSIINIMFRLIDSLDGEDFLESTQHLNENDSSKIK